MTLTSLLAPIAILGIVTPALAQPSGEISVNGSDVYTPTQITFSNPANVGGTGGSFSAIPNCSSCVTMIADLTEGESSGQLFDASSGGHTSTLDLTSPAMFVFTPDAINPALDALEVTGDGNLSLDGDSVPGSYVLTTQGPDDGASHVTFSATAVPTVTVPAPPIGATIPGLIAVFGALALYKFSRV